MNRKQTADRKERTGGIRLNQLNVTLIIVGLVIAVLMVITMYQTTESVNEIVTVTTNYLNNQQTGGMLRDFAGNLSGQAMAFVQNTEPGLAMAYEAQLNVINAQLKQYQPETSNSDAANEAYQRAVDAFRARGKTEAHAMRLAAGALPEAVLGTLPEFIRQEELSAEEQAFSAEEKKAAAAVLLTSEEYTAYGEAINKAVENSHRLSSERGQIQAAETNAKVQTISGQQKLLLIIFAVIAVSALLLNRLLIISPIQKSVDNLDRREPIPERGSHEMRHLARVYNEVLRDNEQKTEALSYTATHDALTGVYNRAAFDKTYRALEKDTIGLIVVDVDYFKQYNDEFGHDIGDRVLCEAADALKRNFRSEDHISRIGGDEFCIIMPGTDQSQGTKFRDKILEINKELAKTSEGLPPVTISAGIAFWDRPNPQGSIFKDADTTLLELKKSHEICCAVYEG